MPIPGPEMHRASARVYNRTQDYGGNFGGPLIPFGSFKEKLFVFVNFERSYSPITNARTITVLTPDAQKGIYTYVVSGTTNQLRTANVLEILPPREACRTTLDPVAQAILAINNQVPQYATQIPDTDLNRDTYTWNAENNNYAYFPTTRFDYFVTPKQQLTLTWNYRHNWQAGERRLPVPDINRTNPFRLGYFVWSAALQSTFASTNLQRIPLRRAAQRRHQYASLNMALTISSMASRCASAALCRSVPLVPFIDQQNVTGRHFITTMYDTLTLNRGSTLSRWAAAIAKPIGTTSGRYFRFLLTAPAHRQATRCSVQRLHGYYPAGYQQHRPG